MHPLWLLWPAGLLLTAAGYMTVILWADLRAGDLRWRTAETAIGAGTTAAVLSAGLIAAWGAVA